MTLHSYKDTANPFEKVNVVDYLTYRPLYPKEMINNIIRKHLSSPNDLVVDLWTGNGQVAIEFAKAGYTTIWIDPNKEMLASWHFHFLLDKRLGTAENTWLQDSSVDLITIGSSIHWFDIDAFFNEAYRILKPWGIITAFSYDAWKNIESLNSFLQDYFRENFITRFNHGTQEELKKYIYEWKYKNLPTTPLFTKVGYESHEILTEIQVHDYIELVKTTAGALGYNIQNNADLWKTMYDDLSAYLQDYLIHKYSVFCVTYKKND